MNKQPKNLVCLWYEKDAEEAAKFYATTFPDSSVSAIQGKGVRPRTKAKVVV